MVSSLDMKDVALLLNDMVAAGVITDYAVFGAVAQMRYTEAVVTMDVEILVALPDTDRFDLLVPVYHYCDSQGYCPEGEAIRVGDWPVQFIPVFSPLTEESVQQAKGCPSSSEIRVARTSTVSEDRSSNRQESAPS